MILDQGEVSFRPYSPKVAQFQHECCIGPVSSRLPAKKGPKALHELAGVMNI